VGGITEGYQGKRVCANHQCDCTGSTQNEGCPTQGYGRPGDPIVITGTSGLGDLPDPAAANAHAGKRAHQVGDGSVKSDDADARWTKKDSKDLSPDNPQKDGDHLGTANECGGFKNLAVTILYERFFHLKA
jgi:hypothetical protein